MRNKKPYYFSRAEIAKIIRRELEIEMAEGQKSCQTEKSYTYDDFTQYDGEEFIVNAYLVLLKREVDRNALDYFLGVLETGEISKVEIIIQLKNSDEGKRANVKFLEEDLYQ